MGDASRAEAVADSAIVAADRIEAATRGLQSAAAQVRTQTEGYRRLEREVRRAKAQLHQAKNATPADAAGVGDAEGKVKAADRKVKAAEGKLKAAEPSLLAAGESLRLAACEVVGAGGADFLYTRLGALEAAADKVQAARDRFHTEAGVVRNLAHEVRRSNHKALVDAPLKIRVAEERLRVAEAGLLAAGGSPESPGVGNHRADHEVIVQGRNIELAAAKSAAAEAKQELVVAKQELQTAESELRTAEAELVAAGRSLRKAGGEVLKARDKVPHSFEPTTYLSGTSPFPPLAYTEITHLLELDSGRYPEHRRALEEWQHREKALSNRVSRREQRSGDITNHIFNIIGWYAVFLGVVLTAVSQLTSTANGKPVCGKAWFPVVLTAFGTLVTVGGLYYKFTVFKSLEVTIQSEKQTSLELQRRISKLKRVGPQRFSFWLETKDLQSTVQPKTFEIHRVLVFLSLVAFSGIFSLSYFVILCDLWVRH